MHLAGSLGIRLFSQSLRNSHRVYEINNQCFIKYVANQPNNSLTCKFFSQNVVYCTSIYSTISFKFYNNQIFILINYSVFILSFISNNAKRPLKWLKCSDTCTNSSSGCQMKRHTKLVSTKCYFQMTKFWLNMGTIFIYYSFV